MIDVLLFAGAMGVLMLILWLIERVCPEDYHHPRVNVPPMPPVKPPRQPTELESLLDHMETNGADPDDIRELRKLIGDIK